MSSFAFLRRFAVVFIVAITLPITQALAASPDAANAQPPTGPNQFALWPCRASVLDPNADQNVPAQPAPEAGQYLLYGVTPVKIIHDNNCWSPTQLQRMGNHRNLSDIKEVVIHWTDLDYARSVYVLQRGVSVHWLVPLAPDPSEPTLELIDPRNAAWHAGPLNEGLWEDAAHLLCIPGSPCRPNGNVHSLGFENVGNSTPNTYQVGVMSDILATLIREGYPVQLDRQHIVGHRELDRYKSDPGNLDIAHLIQMVQDKLLVQSLQPAPAPAPLPTPVPAPVADGSSAHPYPFTTSAYGRLAGNSGGSFTYYTFTPTAGRPLTLHFNYTGIAAAAGAVGIGIYQGTTKIGTLSPPGNQSGQSITIQPPATTPVVIQVYSYVPQTVNWQMYAG